MCDADYGKHSSHWIPIVKDKSKSNEISKTHEIKKTSFSVYRKKNKNKDAVGSIFHAIEKANKLGYWQQPSP